METKLPMTTKEIQAGYLARRKLIILSLTNKQNFHTQFNALH